MVDRHPTPKQRTHNEPIQSTCNGVAATTSYSVGFSHDTFLVKTFTQNLCRQHAKTIGQINKCADYRHSLRIRSETKQQLNQDGVKFTTFTQVLVYPGSRTLLLL